MNKCNKCGKSFPASGEEFYNRGEMESGYGHCPHCGSMVHSGNVAASGHHGVHFPYDQDSLKAESGYHERINKSPPNEEYFSWKKKRDQKSHERWLSSIGYKKGYHGISYGYGDEVFKIGNHAVKKKSNTNIFDAGEYFGGY